MFDLQRITKLKENYDNGLIPKLHKHEVNPNLLPGDRLNYLYFTLPVSLNFQRSSPAMGASALRTFEDPETNYLFFPEKVVEVTFEKLQRDLMEHRFALQKNKHVQIWQRLSRTLFDNYNSDPREIIKQGQNCVVRIKNILQITQKKNFPYLSGPKMANYWLYILHNFTDIKLRNLHKITIILDTHVIQCTIKLGLAKEGAGSQEIAEIWEKVLKNTNYIPIDFHPILWNWSRNNFIPEV